MPEIVYPVIFVPGITASELRDEYPVETERVWSLLLRNYERTRLHPDNPRYEAREPARVVPDRVFQLVYSEFIEELRHSLSSKADRPTPVFTFPYDWRQPLEVTARLLGDFVREVMERTALLPHYHQAGYGHQPLVNLVGHSMGGLVISEYLSQTGTNHGVHKIATLGTPFRGSFEAVLKVATGTADIGDNKGASRERETARVTPALYHLLPEYPGAIEADPGLSKDLFDRLAWQPGVEASLREYIRLYGLRDGSLGNTAQRAEALFDKMLGQAKSHRNRVTKLKLGDHGLDSKRWLSVVGLGEKTRVRLKIQSKRGKPWFDLDSGDRENDWSPKDWQGRTNTGDGTVPYHGARANFIPTEEVVCVSDNDFGYWELKDRALEAAGVGLHATLPLMNLVQRLVASHFAGKKQGKIWGRPAPDIGHANAWSPPFPVERKLR